MAFGTSTINSATPAKDLMAALSTALVGAGFTQVESYATPASVTWNVGYGNNMFVMVGQNTSTAATSTDGGVTWVPRVLPLSQTWIAVGYGNGLWVAIAQASTTYATSTDGINWTSRQLPVAGSFYQIVYANGLWVTMAGTVILTSPDGINWTQRTSAFNGVWRGLTYGNGTWVAVTTASATALSSTDGITWTVRAMATSASWYGVSYGNGLFVAVANSGTTYNTSPDGINWTARTWTSAAYTGVAFFNGLFVTVPSGLSFLMSSPDGLTWTSRSLPSTYTGTSVAGSATSAVMATNGSVCLTSSDEITWVQRNASGASTTATTDVYKSAGAGNAFGSDWFLLLKRNNDPTVTLSYQVAETYDAPNHRASNFGGLGTAVTPAATTYLNPTAPATADNVFAGGAALSLTSGVAFSYWYSITKDRLVVGIKTTTESGFYCGLYDDLLPAGVTQFPLMCAQFPPIMSTAYAIGGGNSLSSGGFTREPGQSAVTVNNFEARIGNNYWLSSTSQWYIVSNSYTPMTDTAALYGNSNILARVLCGSGRLVSSNVANAVRGLLSGVYSSPVSSLAGDTITAGGKTYVRVCGPSTTVGYFVDQAL